MECKDCKYHHNDTKYNYNMCEITHVINTKSCTYIKNDNKVDNMNICFNCKYWIGGGDWGLSCEKDYLNCSANGFDEACEQFERK